jgi:hypothetical protein
MQFMHISPPFCCTAKKTGMVVYGVCQPGIGPAEPRRSATMKVIQTELEPQVRAVPVSETLAPVRTLPTAKRRITLMPALVEARLFHAL